ncbi:MAG TPA: exodeoxyribonuclease III [Thermoanaerobaculia bacterium]|nr:exodeoxyribonuclease III [Thermoanaerobaculia bacterium]
MSITFATWNVNGIRARGEQFLAWIERDRPDVVCLQELKASPDKIAEPICNLAGYWCYWHGAGGYSGVSLHLRRDTFPEEPRFHHPAFDHETRIVAADTGDLTLISVYVPNGGKDFGAKMDFLAALEAWAGEQKAQGRRLILGGDLNVTRTDQDVHPKERKKNAIGQLPEERERFASLLGQGGLVDVGRTLDPDNDDLFTWWAPWRSMRQRNIGWRIDYVLASEAVATHAAACRVLADVGTSDHAPVLAAFEMPHGRLM